MSAEFQKPLSFKEIQEKSDKYVLHTYNRYPVCFYFGQGEVLYDTDQKEYIDFLSGVAVNSLGYGDADIIEAVREQADRVIHTSNYFYNQEQANLAEVIVENAFPGKVFFCNSGTEANEGAFKLARSFGQQTKNADKILAIQGGFHGRTAASMSMTGQEKIHSGFGPLIQNVTFIDPDDEDAAVSLLQNEGHQYCAVIMELIQGENGVVPLSEKFVRTIRELTIENDIILIIDEIQTGIGRTGKLFAFEHYGITPDVMTLAKALGSGIPIGAIVVADKFTQYLKPGMHGSTFGGNHLAARVGYEVIKNILSRDLLSHVNSVSEYMFTRLNDLKNRYPVIKEIRGKGLMIGMELETPCADIVKKALSEGLILNCTAGNTIRMVPPLTLSLETADKAVTILEKVLKS